MRITGGGEYLVAVASAEPQEVMPRSAVLLDRSRKLIGEEMYKQHLELEQLKLREQEARTALEQSRLREQDAQATIAQLRSTWLDPQEAAMRAALIDRLLALVGRNATATFDSEEIRQLRDQLQISQMAYEELTSMVSLKLMQKAKRVWDRVPVLKNAVKAVIKRTL